MHFAARFAAKEAAWKALGLPGGLRWRDIEVRPLESGAPTLVVSASPVVAAAPVAVPSVAVEVVVVAEPEVVVSVCARMISCPAVWSVMVAIRRQIRSMRALPLS